MIRIGGGESWARNEKPSNVASVEFLNQHSSRDRGVLLPTCSPFSILDCSQRVADGSPLDTLRILDLLHSLLRLFGTERSGPSINCVDEAEGHALCDPGEIDSSGVSHRS